MSEPKICKKPVMSQGRIKNLVMEEGNLRIQNLCGDLPEPLIRANEAASIGQTDKARQILHEQCRGEIEELLNNDSSRTDIMLIVAMIFRQVGRINMAKQLFEKIISQEPHGLIYNELGQTCEHIGSVSESIQHYRKAVQLSPEYGQLWVNLARALIETGQAKEGLAMFRKAVESDPDNAAIHSNLLFYLHHLPDINSEILFEEHLQWSRKHIPEQLTKKAYKNSRVNDRKLRIGYISPNFGSHPVTHFFEPLLDGHNREAVELYGYGNVMVHTHITERLKNKFGYYRNIRGMDNESIVEMIENDRIDILVDLSGHTADNSLMVMGHKPAPIQVAYLGYIYTTGMSAIDYRLTDELTESSDSQNYCTEESVFLPNGFYCYQPLDEAGPVGPLPASKNGYITFGVLGSSIKINPVMIELWAKILHAVKNSRLFFKFTGGNDNQVQEYYFEQFEKFGIDRDRIEITGWVCYTDYLEQYNNIDIVLDTYPKNGATTTCEALWMGVPVVSLVGKLPFSRTRPEYT
ncbi:MAG: tetratricopeptide repeat protein [Planctomycetes bacterium]|nr:tetratricopeptide repeat protein [Planctomycetota bacterium]